MSTVDSAVIHVQRARVHNLQSVDVEIPHGQLVVITGVSGSGKSSLAFDTIFSEGQRRYLASLSHTARQLIAQRPRPPVDRIDGLPATVSVSQHAAVPGRRSTVATLTELAGFLQLLFARCGRLHCPQCGRPVSQQSEAAITGRLASLPDKTKVMLLAPLIRGRRGAHRAVFEQILKDGLVRARVDGEIIDPASPPDLDSGRAHDIEAVADRLVIREGIETRLAESVRFALELAAGTLIASCQIGEDWRDLHFSRKLHCSYCELDFPDIEPNTFNFNSPHGACSTCSGLGVMRTDEPSPRTRKRPADHVSTGEPAPLETTCPDCQGTRLRELGRSVQLGGKTFPQAVSLAVDDALTFARQLQTEETTDTFTPAERQAVERILPPLTARLQCMLDVGLSYLPLDRLARTLSGGEFQRARLAAHLGGGLTGVCFVLDEPTTGLHARDTDRLLDVLDRLRANGNTILVVEHDVRCMQRADRLIEIGPGAGQEGGTIVAAGTPETIRKQAGSLTGALLRDPKSLEAYRSPRPIDWEAAIQLRNARVHNLQNVSTRFPLHALTCVVGVSGSGKSSLVRHALLPGLRRLLTGPGRTRAVADPETTGTVETSLPIDRVVEIDQSPLGRNARSCPATYSGIWDQVRKLLARSRASQLRGWTSRRFSLNAKGGRCELCTGRGVRIIQTRLMPPVEVPCPACAGRRFNRQTLAVQFKGLDASQLLELRVDEAVDVFANVARIRSTLQTFVDLGLGYLQLGQRASTLSGGEAQRVKLATELAGGDGLGETVIVLDEPTAGLHPRDIARLTELLGRLVEDGKTLIVIEHDLSLISASDWMIELGPEAGVNGGRIVAEGTPSQCSTGESTYTIRALRQRVEH